MKNLALQKTGILSQIALENGVQTFSQLLHFVRHLTYHRISVPLDLKLVLIEKQGTCSTKHAVIKCIAEEQGWGDVKLMLGSFLMSSANVNGVGEILSKYGLSHIVEAHCYLHVKDEPVDITFPDNDNMPDIIDEIEILPHQISVFKQTWHRNALWKWINTHSSKYSLPELWEIREECIKAISIKG